MSNPTPDATTTSETTPDLEARIALLERALSAVSERNRRVESNKAWETSRTRLLSITAVTYVTMVLVCTVLGTQRAFLQALVPTIGFFLSTLSLPLIRALWERYSR